MISTDKWTKKSRCAVFFCSFDLCLGGISLLNERGISIPEQMSVIGFDDDRMFSGFSPSITVIAQDFLQIGV